MIGGYIGVVLLSAAFISIGLFASSLTGNQIVAAVVTFMFLLILWLIGAAADFTGSPVADILRYMAIDRYYNDFVRGVVDTKAVIYFLSIVAVFLFATVRSLETRRWR